MIVRAEIVAGYIERVSFIPTMINDRNQPVPLQANDDGFGEVLDYVEWISEDFPHDLIVDGGEVVVSV